MRLHELDLNLLVILDRLARDGSVSHAAQALGMSQPAISNGLRRLRDHYGDQLFQQIGGRMSPTPFAETLIVRVQEALLGLEDVALSRDLFLPAHSKRVFRIACSDYAFSVLITAVIRRLRTIAPDVQLRCILTGEQAPDWLRDGAIDFLIGPRERLVCDHPEVALFEDDFSCVVWKENSDIGDSISTEQFLASEHVSTMLGPTRMNHLQDEAFARHQLKPHIAYFAPNFLSVAEVLVGTGLIATMHTRAARQAVERLPLRLVKPPVAFRPFTEMLQWHRRTSDDPGIVWLKDLIVEEASAIA